MQPKRAPNFSGLPRLWLALRTRGNRQPMGWLLAFAAAALAMLARAALEPAIGDSVPFVFAFPATVLAALLWGAGPAILAGSVCLIWVLLPGVQPSLTRGVLPVQLGAFAASTIATVLICTAFRQDERSPSSGPSLSVEDTALTRWLRAALWGAALLPATIFVSVAWWGYDRAFIDAERTAQRAGSVVRAHAERVLQAAGAVAGKASQVVASPLEAVPARARDARNRISDLVMGLSGVEEVSVWDAAGSLIASSAEGPPALAVRDSPYFIKARDEAMDRQVTRILDRPSSAERTFHLVVRRQTPDGRFDGVVTVRLASSLFQSFYQSLATEEPGLNTFSLFTTDGDLLARWPAPTASTTRVPARSAVLARARAGAAQDVFFVGSAFDTERRLFSLQRVGDSAAYVTSGLSQSYILSTWHRFVELLGIVLAPITAVLVYVSWIALKKSRQQAVMLAHLREEHERRLRAEASAMQSQKLEALSLLTGRVAHDFNNLLAIVANNLHVQRRLHPELGDGAALPAMERAVSSGVKLTKQLLSFSRTQPVRPETVSLQQWLPRAAALLTSTVGRSIELRIDVDSGTCPIFVDTNELELALINLAANARDSMPNGGTLFLQAANGQAEQEGFVCIRVSDSGCGIDARSLGKVFEPFFTTKGPTGGTGLGLSQVHGFCHHAGGSVVIASTEGAGTVVTMCLPHAAAAVNELQESRRSTVEKLGGHVLVVEDNEDLGRALESLLTTSGVTVRRTTSADEALAVFLNGAETFEAIISDIALPGSLNGLDLAEHVRRNAKSIPVILVTGYSARYRESVARGFETISKPADPDQLLATLHRMLATTDPSPAGARTIQEQFAR